MGDRMKQRLVGAAVLVIAAVVFVPMLLTQDEEPTARIVQSEPTPAPQPAPTVVPATGSTGEAVTRALEPLPEEPAPAVKQPQATASPAPEPAKSAPEKAPEKQAAAKKAAPTKAAPAGGFSVQIGSFTQPGNAHGLRDRLKARGYPAFARSSGSVTRVYVGPQKSRADAERVQEKLRREQKIKGIVVTHPG